MRKQTHFYSVKPITAYTYRSSVSDQTIRVIHVSPRCKADAVDGLHCFFAFPFDGLTFPHGFTDTLCHATICTTCQDPGASSLGGLQYERNNVRAEKTIFPQHFSHNMSKVLQMFKIIQIHDFIWNHSNKLFHFYPKKASNLKSN